MVAEKLCKEKIELKRIDVSHIASSGKSNVSRKLNKW